MNTPSFIFLQSEVVVLLAYPDLYLPEAEYIKVILEPEGFHFLCAENAADLVRIYKERRDEIDLVVVLTYHLQRTESPAVLHALQAIHPGVRCAFITGLYDKGKLGELTRRGAVGVLRKPCRFEDLLPTMRQWSQQ